MDGGCIPTLAKSDREIRGSSEIIVSRSGDHTPVPAVILKISRKESFLAVTRRVRAT